MKLTTLSSSFRLITKSFEYTVFCSVSGFLTYFSMMWKLGNVQEVLGMWDNVKNLLNLQASVSPPVCSEILQSVPPNFFDPYFYYSSVENEEILVAISKENYFSDHLHIQKQKKNMADGPLCLDTLCRYFMQILCVVTLCSHTAERSNETFSIQKYSQNRPSTLGS